MPGKVLLRDKKEKDANRQFVEMWTVDADEAIRKEPDRWEYAEPNSKPSYVAPTTPNISGVMAENHNSLARASQRANELQATGAQVERRSVPMSDPLEPPAGYVERDAGKAIVDADKAAVKDMKAVARERAPAAERAEKVAQERDDQLRADRARKGGHQ